MPAELFPPEVELAPILRRDIKPWEREGDLPDLEHGDGGLHLQHAADTSCSGGLGTAGSAGVTADDGERVVREGVVVGNGDDGDDADASTEDGEHTAGVYDEVHCSTQSWHKQSLFRWPQRQNGKMQNGSSRMPAHL